MNIKVGDIFYKNKGIATFYQVVKVYKSGRVIIREIEKEESETDCSYEYLAKPIPNKFVPKREYAEFEKKYVDIIDNDKGKLKVVQYEDDEPILSFKYFDAYLWKEEKIVSNYYNIWMK